MMHERFELKYCIKPHQAVLLEKMLHSSFELDKNCNEDGNYTVHSLYFDDLRNTSAYEVEAGLPQKTKYRIRYYNSDLTSLKLEIKNKNVNSVRKETCPISVAEYELIMGNKGNELFWNTSKDLLKRFAILMQTKILRPKVIVTYKRVPFVSLINETRLTIDSDISAYNKIDDFLEIGLAGIAFKTSVLEIKYNHYLPKLFKDIFAVFHLSQATFSKYYNARVNLGDRI